MPDDLLATCWTSAGSIDPFSAEPSSPVDPVDRVRSLARHGFTGAGFLISDLRGRDLATIGSALDDASIVHRQVELLTRWWEPAQASAVTEALDLAAGIGATQIKAAADMDDLRRPLHDLTDAWVDLAERTHSIGAQLVIEPVPFSHLPTVEHGARFVQAAGHPNGGLLIDYWHVVRGGSTFASLRSALDPAYVMAVELCDGAGPKPVGVDLATDATINRSLPGEGAWDVRGLVRLLRDIGYAGPWAVEMLSPWFQALPHDEALSRAAEATRSVLA